MKRERCPTCGLMMLDKVANALWCEGCGTLKVGGSVFVSIGWRPRKEKPTRITIKDEPHRLMETGSVHHFTDGTNYDGAGDSRPPS